MCGRKKKKRKFDFGGKLPVFFFFLLMWVFFSQIPLLSHHHPAVSLNARELLEGKRVSSSVDVIEVHSLSQFLDRFVYKRPKKIVGGGETKTKGTSIMQPVLHDRIGDVMKKERWMKKEIGDNQVGDVEEVVNSRTFAEREVVDVGVDEVCFFFFAFFF